MTGKELACETDDDLWKKSNTAALENDKPDDIVIRKNRGVIGRREKPRIVSQTLCVLFLF